MSGQAICVDNSQDQIQFVTKDSSAGTNPVVSCETGYTMTGCTCNDEDNYAHNCLGTKMSLIGEQENQTF